MNWEIGQNIFVGLMAVWLILLLSGKYQIRQIKRNTVKIVLEEAEKRKAEKVEIELGKFYAEISPIWASMVRHSSLFIPNKTEVIPIPARPEWVMKRINFTEEWVGAFLKMNDYPVLCTPAQKQKIDRILALRKPESSGKPKSSEENQK